VVPREVPELVREHRPELLAGQARHQRQADDEIVGRPADQTEPWHLGDRGVEVRGHDHAVDALRADALPHRLDLVEELRRLAADHDAPFRRRDPHPHRLQHQPREDERDPGDLDQDELLGDEDQRRGADHQPERRHERRRDEPDPEHGE
jgi:hypothetical protein